jgi:small nuclear ribonucleoprotein (snRNP)-like protein
LIIGKCIDRIKRVGVLEDIENETNMVIDDVKEYFGVK